MKPRWQKQRDGAFTLVDALVCFFVIAVLAMVVLTDFNQRHKSRGIYCVSNIKQVNLSFRIWEGDNNNQYPMAVSTSLGGAMELAAANNVAACFQVMSNELSTPRILVCPVDSKRVPAIKFSSGFNASNISYFIGIDASNEDNPQRLLCGDNNFQINGTVVGSSVLSLSTNVPISWTAARHVHVGNLGFADGSVAEESTSGLQQALVLTGLATNRLAIP